MDAGVGRVVLGVDVEIVDRRAGVWQVDCEVGVGRNGQVRPDDTLRVNLVNSLDALPPGLPQWWSWARGPARSGRISPVPVRSVGLDSSLAMLDVFRAKAAETLPSREPENSVSPLLGMSEVLQDARFAQKARVLGPTTLVPIPRTCFIKPGAWSARRDAILGSGWLRRRGGYGRGVGRGQLVVADDPQLA